MYNTVLCHFSSHANCFHIFINSLQEFLFCNESSGNSEWRKHSGCSMFICALCPNYISKDRHFYKQGTPMHLWDTSYSAPSCSLCLFSFLISSSRDHIGTFAAVSHEDVISRLSVLLHRLAICLSALRHSQPPCCHQFTMSLGFEPQRTQAFLCMCLCVSAGLRDSGDTVCSYLALQGALDKFAFLSQGGGIEQGMYVCRVSFSGV